MEDNEYEIVEGKIEQLKSYIRFRDLGFTYVYGLALAIQLVLSAYVRIVIKSDKELKTLLFLLTLAGIIAFIVFTSKGLAIKKSFKWYHFAFYILFIVLLFSLVYIDFLIHSGDVWPILGPVWIYILLSLGILIFLIYGYFKSESIEELRDSKRATRMDLIKYYILAVISNEDSKLEKYSADKANDLNSNMINKIVCDSVLSERFSQCSETFKNGFNLKTVEYKNKSNISFATITISAIVSFFVTGFNKVYDSWNNYLMAVWKVGNNCEIFEGISNQETINYYKEILNLTIAYQCLILATIILIFVCVCVYRSILNTTNSTRLENFKLSQIVLSNIKHELKLLNDKKEKDIVSQSATD